MFHPASCTFTDSCALSPPPPPTTTRPSRGYAEQVAREGAAAKLVQSVLDADKNADSMGAANGLAQDASATEVKTDGTARKVLAILSSACNPATSICRKRVRLAHAQAYVLKRLVRGLGSGRQGARQGFALALTALLGARPSLSPASVLELMDQHLPFSKSMQASCWSLCLAVWHMLYSIGMCGRLEHMGNMCFFCGSSPHGSRCT